MGSAIFRVVFDAHYMEKYKKVIWSTYSPNLERFRAKLHEFFIIPQLGATAYVAEHFEAFQDAGANVGDHLT